MSVAPCGCPSIGVECAVCLNPMCRGAVSYGETVCASCLVETTKKSNLHPVRRTPVAMCKCGKPFVGLCRSHALPNMWIYNTVTGEAVRGSDFHGLQK